MNFELSHAQQDLQRSVRAYLDQEIRPIAIEYGDSRIPKAHLCELFARLRPFGYMEISDDLLTAAVLSEELSRVFPSLEGIMLINLACAQFIREAGPDKLKGEAVPALLAGEKVGCIASTEPGVGSNNASVETEAAFDGDEYVINGRKRWISDGEISDYAVVLCRTNFGNDRREISPIIVEREVSPYEGGDLPKIGLRAFPTSELRFENCRVPRENCLGAEKSAFGLQLFFNGLQWSRCRMALIAVGIAQAALDAAALYARNRIQFGKRIGEFQLIQNMIAEMAMEIDAARLLTFRAVDYFQKGIRCDREASMAKAHATEMAVQVASRAIQIHGANGLSPDFHVERYLRDARVLTIPDGTTEIHKLVIARAELGISAFQ